ncbi:unnamed protein product, partial [Mesorhabditis spiculigera]
MHKIFSRPQFYPKAILMIASAFLIIFSFHGKTSTTSGHFAKRNVESSVAAVPQNGLNTSVNSQMRILEFEKKFCLYKTNCTILQPMIDYSGRHLMAEHFGIAACAILKNFSTVLTSIMCYLYDIASYENVVQDMMQDTWDFRHCGNKNEFFGAGGQRRIEMAKMQSKLNLWRYYVLTREPMERFISGFLDKCVIKAEAKNKTVPTGTSCYGCKGDLACFIKAQYNSFLVATRGGKPGYSMENEHFAPQTWYCQLGSHFSEYRFFHYSHPTTGQMLDELFDEFEALGVPKRMGDYEDLTFLWLPPHPTSPPDYPILDEEHKIAYGIPQIVAAFIGFPVNIGMLIVAIRRTKDLCSTFFYFILAQLCLLNLIQMQSHMVAAVITLVADTGPKFSMLTIPLGYAACFSSDLLRGVISLHRMTLIAFPHRAKDIPKWVFMTILIFDIFLFFFVAIKFYTPQGAAYFSPRQLLFLKFDKIWIFSQITNQIRICCNYISLVAGALSYAVITPLLLFHKRKLKKADYTITIQLFVTFCCSIICFVGWEVVLPWADDSTPTTAVLINFISQLLWVLQCSQEPAVLFIFNKSLRRDLRDTFFGVPLGRMQHLTVSMDTSSRHTSGPNVFQKASAQQHTIQAWKGNTNLKRPSQ